MIKIFVYLCILSFVYSLTCIILHHIRLIVGFDKVDIGDPSGNKFCVLASKRLIKRTFYAEHVHIQENLETF